MQNDELSSVQDSSKLAGSLNLAENIVAKEYLQNLNSFEVLDMSQKLRDLQINDYVRIFKINRIVLDKNESILEKLVTVLNAAYSSMATVMVIVCGKGDTTEYYLGIVSKDQQNNAICAQSESFKSSLKGNFPGMEFDSLMESDITNLNQYIFSEENNCISSISGIASIRNEKNEDYMKNVQGIEHLIDAMRGKYYSVVFIADSISNNELHQAKTGYENLCTQISPYLKTTLMFNEADSINSSEAYTEGVSNTITNSISLTQNYSKTEGWTKSETKSTSKTKNPGALGTVAGMGIGAMLGGGLPGAIAGATIGGVAGSAAVGSKSTSESKTDGVSNSETTGSSYGKTDSNTSGTQKSNTKTQGNSQTRGRTLQLSNENRVVKDVINRIDKNIERIEKCESFGAFNCATYIISSDPETNAMVANEYNALTRGDNSYLETSYINDWKNSDNERKVKAYIEKFTHPLFYDKDEKNIVLSPATLSNSYETAVNVGLPKNSVNGLQVSYEARFGRNVYENINNKEDDEEICLGSIFHMGFKEEEKVNLSVPSLCMHTFITGSTGSGKSNAIYNIINKLCLKKSEYHFLVIEPSKGEYKETLGGYKGVNVFGTNVKKTEMLRINPFSFPNEIHVLEHIDRIVEIFNACWPMYAAMPAVLKAAIEKAYVNVGWDIKNSICEDKRFPTCVDVMNALPGIVDSKGFSSDTQGDYKGALLTRLESLTNGINREILCSQDDVSDEQLFDQNTIVDISRIGSSETKALLMGILVLKLQEYRIQQREDEIDNKINQTKGNQLRHITVLEEAHNLLKATSTDQHQEEANLQGKSVEMITNSIAELRSFGEGFIIADQAPGLLDKAVIRNTNTKIILRLPDEEDRKLVGKAANLNDDQIVELAKLHTGVAAVYQNDWLEPVLCQIDEYTEYRPYIKSEKGTSNEPQYEIFLKNMISPLNERKEFSNDEKDSIRRWINGLDIGDYTKNILRQEINENVEPENVGEILYKVVKGKRVFGSAIMEDDVRNARLIIESSIMNYFGISRELSKQIGEVVTQYVIDNTEDADELRKVYNNESVK